MFYFRLRTRHFEAFLTPKYRKIQMEAKIRYRDFDLLTFEGQGNIRTGGTFTSLQMTLNSYEAHFMQGTTDKELCDLIVPLQTFNTGTPLAMIQKALYDQISGFTETYLRNTANKWLLYLYALHACHPCPLKLNGLVVGSLVKTILSVTRGTIEMTFNTESKGEFEVVWF